MLRTSPVRESSPAKHFPSRSGKECFVISISESKIGKSKDDPSFLTSAGARFTVFEPPNREMCDDLAAACTRPIASFTAVSGSPIILVRGSGDVPLCVASTNTGIPLMPFSANVATTLTMIIPLSGAEHI